MPELSRRWKAIPKEEHADIVAEAIAERNSKVKAAVKAELSTPAPRRKRLDDHAKDVSQSRGEMSQSGMVTAGIIVLPQDGENPAISKVFASNAIGIL